MAKYNYFDDDEEILKERQESSARFEKIIFKIECIFVLIVDFVKEHSYTPKELEALPLLKKRLLKLAAVCLFLLVVVIAIIIFATSINGVNKSNEQFCRDSGVVCTDYIAEYGACKAERLDEKYGEKMSRITGIAYARRMDFDGDNQDELMVCYLNRGIYTLDVWAYVKKDFKKI